LHAAVRDSMLKRNHRFFQSAQVIRDSLLVGCAFFIAHHVRFSFPNLLPFGTVSPEQETFWVGMMAVILWPAIGWMSGLYVSRRSRSIAAEVFDVIRVSIVAFVVLVTLTYYIRDERFSRGTLLLWTGFSSVAVGASRAALRIFLRKLRFRGYNLRHVVIVGVGNTARRVWSTIREQQRLGLRLRGFVALDEDQALVGEKVDGVPVLGTVRQLRELVQGTDQVLVALSIEKLGALKEIMGILSQEPVDVRLVPDFYQYATLYGSIDELAGLPIINLQATPLMGWGFVTKRLFDIVVSGIGLVLLAPVLAVVTLWVRLASGGPVLYRQERVGMDGKPFDMFKFRTMRLDAETDGAHRAVPGDPRCTREGVWLRRLSLDELPQLWNVFRGDMSLVGPRPERPCFIEDFKREIPRYGLRHKIKAGITGWAQVNGMRGNTSVEKRIELDLYYIENWSLSLDIKILIRTVLGGFLSPNAY